MKRTDIINSLIEKYDYKNYLEIGVFFPSHNFNHINVENKTGVDVKFYEEPLSGIKHEMSSDNFFENLKPSWWNEEVNTYDIIFVDGLHLFEQTYKDIQNSLKHLSDGGTIVVHDCNPVDKFRTRDINEFHSDGKPWNGTVYKAIVKLICENPNLEIKVVDTDEGCGIIRKYDDNIVPKSCKDIDINNLSYQDFDKNRNELLNLISIEEFEKKYLEN
tara:strand:+ start:953 stop:1603 length:651 start_codon:yes stop_codon:yes gene_type:complete